LEIVVLWMCSLTEKQQLNFYEEYGDELKDLLKSYSSDYKDSNLIGSWDESLSLTIQEKLREIEPEGVYIDFNAIYEPNDYSGISEDEFESKILEDFEDFEVLGIDSNLFTQITEYNSDN
jgi:hypothetical protein